MLFIILRIATHRFHALTRPGTVFGLFLVFYGIFRSAVEFVREPHAGHPMDVGIFTPGIVYSIPMILLGAWLIWRARRQPALARRDGRATQSSKRRGYRRSQRG